MSGARARILGRLRHALSNPDLPFPPAQTDPLRQDERLDVTWMERGEDLGARFRREFEALHGSCEESPSKVAARIHAIQKIQSWSRQAAPGGQSDVRRILVWPNLDAHAPGLRDGLENLGFSLYELEHVADRDERTDIQTIALGITSAHAAFAGTGSILLKSGDGQSRLPSLLPFRHLVLIPRQILWPNVESWLRHEHERGTLGHTFRGSANLTLVSGPSKSADIESKLTLGVHGPQDVHVILVPDS